MCALTSGQHGAVHQMDAAAPSCNSPYRVVTGGAQQRATGIDAGAHRATDFRVQRVA
ncbi:hypothetical protein D3C71_2169610 [compost metagenome]